MKRLFIFAVLLLSQSARTVLAQPPAPPPAPNAPPVGNPQPPLPPAAEAVPAPGFDLAQLEEMALSRNPAMAQAQGRIEAAQGKWDQAGAFPNPVLAYEGTEIGNNGGKAGFQGGSVMQQIVTGGKRRLDQSVASSEAAVAEQQFAVQQGRLLSDVRIEFYGVLANQRAITLNQELAGLGEQGVKAAEQLYKAKQVSLADVLQSQVEHETAKLALDSAKTRYTAAWRRLATVVGEPDLPPAPLRGDLEAGIGDITWADSLGRLLSQSPELSVAAMSLERSRWILQRAQAEPIPNVDVGIGLQHDNSSGYDVTNVQVAVPLPLWNRNQGNIRAANAEVAMAEANVHRIELQLRNRLASVFERYDNARNQREKLGKVILPNAKSSLELVLKGYQQGEFGYLMVLTAQRTYFHTNLEYITALREMRESATIIDGMLLTDSLQEMK